MHNNIRHLYKLYNYNTIMGAKITDTNYWELHSLGKLALNIEGIYVLLTRLAYLSHAREAPVQRCHQYL